jgi:hypothetical protein
MSYLPIRKTYYKQEKSKEEIYDPILLSNQKRLESYIAQKNEEIAMPFFFKIETKLFTLN